MRFWKTAFGISLLINIVFAFAWSSKRRTERQMSQMTEQMPDVIARIDNMINMSNEQQAVLKDMAKTSREQTMRMTANADQTEAFLQEYGYHGQ